MRQLPGWKTKRKIVVFESDDWGSFRLKDKITRDKYIKDYSPSDWMNYNDCFESYDDLQALSNVLNEVKDSNNNTACFTFLMNPANPDFEKIENNNFEKYYYESFDTTLSKRKDGDNIYKWYKSALKENIIEIGFHGREHLNVEAWMNDLKYKDNPTRKGFNDRIWGQSIISKTKTERPHRSTFNISDYEELNDLKENIHQGVEIMSRIFHQKPTYFLPPDGPYHLSLNSTLKENGIKYIGLAKLHNNPLELQWYKKKLFWLGKKTTGGLLVITRNVTFEPASPKSNDWVNLAMQNIKEAFKWYNPAVISTHRANYTGTLNEKNRNNGIQQLKTLLHQIKNEWPEVEFMTSSQLGQNIKNS